MVEVSFNSCLYEVHKDALSEKYEVAGLLLAMTHSINGICKLLLKVKRITPDGCLLQTEIPQDAWGIMSLS